MMAVFGSALTSMHDAKNDNSSNSNDDKYDDMSQGGDGSGSSSISFESQVWGDIAGLISAVGYGIYTVLLRSLCSDENRISMNLFLGYIGIVNSISLSPILAFIYANIDNDSNIQYDAESNGRLLRLLESQHLTWFVFFCLVIKGLLDNVLSDYLWARGIILTSATVATVGLGLTIPLALLSDLFVMKRTDVWTFGSVVGAFFVLLGFIFVNVGEDEKKEQIIEDPLVDFDESLDHISLS